MIAINLTKVFFISLFVELAICTCKESGRWCLTNSQCCSHFCSWLSGCKDKATTCAPTNSSCSSDEECCTANCIKAVGHYKCAETGAIKTNDSDWTNQRTEDENNLENENTIPLQLDEKIKEINGNAVLARDNDPESGEHLEHKQNVSATEEKVISLPENNNDMWVVDDPELKEDFEKEQMTDGKAQITEEQFSNLVNTMAPSSRPHHPHQLPTVDIYTQPILQPDKSNVTAPAKPRFNNTIDIDTSSFEKFLSSLNDLDWGD